MTAAAATLPIIGAETLRSAIGYRDLIEPVSRAFQALSAGRAQSDMLVLRPDEDAARGDVYIKSGAIHGESVFIVKISPWFATNVEQGQPQGGFIAVFDADTGHTRAILDEQHYLSDIRTAAAGALAARALAPAVVTTAAVLGAGVQAYWQACALHGERPFESLMIWARDPERARALAERLAPIMPDVVFEIAPSAEAAVRAAEVVIVATASREPLVRGAWLRLGQHITSVGAGDATKCELDADSLGRARVFVDDRHTALAYGNVHRAVTRHDYHPGDLAGEIGELLAGAVPGRVDPAGITIASFVGAGVQDLVAARVALEKLGY
ncbi:MAG: ornithine cyclodeaminase family protein [Sphingomonas bacterium]|nr:ornithine cyclodeaminase family protein [Sphingomonas bacterium]